MNSLIYSYDHIAMLSSWIPSVHLMCMLQNHALLCGPFGKCSFHPMLLGAKALSVVQSLKAPPSQVGLSQWHLLLWQVQAGS